MGLPVLARAARCGRGCVARFLIWRGVSWCGMVWRVVSWLGMWRSMARCKAERCSVGHQNQAIERTKPPPPLQPLTPPAPPPCPSVLPPLLPLCHHCCLSLLCAAAALVLSLSPLRCRCRCSVSGLASDGKSPILVAGDNFGCGSSREHAPWSLAGMVSGSERSGAERIVLYWSEVELSGVGWERSGAEWG